jgi:hypothetical protein
MLFIISMLKDISNSCSKSAMTLFNDLGDFSICFRTIIFCSSVKTQGRPRPGRSINPHIPWVFHLVNQVETVYRQTL